ncbi:hypothetical protein ASE85_14495 [Sphingobium sp. Leaf26]|uniref:hypothetical protein n=1 Tax=Sphingobium sp. Leaf26 TaxID=1735693 RepID=UPI0006F56927|nr:hypothetical protein [Sphingobium sp. Leaf26]KQM97487.1 hypothetical protein ASE85_14495 [Sphingobium sp. Leaf26]
MMKCLLLATALFMAAGPVAAREVSLSVDARSGPWLNKANKKMRYGKGDELPPAMVGGFVNDTAEKIAIMVADGATTKVDGQDVGPEGLEDKAVDDQPGEGGKYYPSLYAPKILYPNHRHALMAAFVDAQGVLMGRPFAVGKGARVTIPDQAAGLVMGFNDVGFAGNSGALAVTVTLPDD